MASPYLLDLKIQYPSGTNLNNVNVTIRVESTNESNTKTTNSAGEVAYNLGSTKEFPSGWQVGDIFSWVVLYQGFEAYGSKTILAQEGGYKRTIVLTTVIAAPSLKIFTVQEFLDVFNVKTIEDDTENGIAAQRIVKVGRMVEVNIENDTNFTFDNDNGSYYEQTEYIDTNKNIDVYHLSKLPVRSITNLYTTQNEESATPDYPNNTAEWTSLTENTDFFVDKGDESDGRVMVVNASYVPITRKRGIYVVYRYGRTLVPSDIKLLALVETGMRLLGTNFLKNWINDKTDATLPDLASFTQWRRNIINAYKFDGLNSMNT
mgnify:CR=1 FL=1